jgi:hypothetical protein
VKQLLRSWRVKSRDAHGVTIGRLICVLCGVQIVEEERKHDSSRRQDQQVEQVPHHTACGRPNTSPDSRAN